MTANQNEKEILLVDDDSDYSDLMSKRLERAGYRVSKASNGTEALKLLECDWRPNLIIMDIEMPNRNGLTTLINMGVRGIHRSEPEANIPVVVATGLQGEQIREIITKQNINAFLRKPFSSQELLETVKNLIG